MKFGSIVYLHLDTHNVPESFLMNRHKYEIPLWKKAWFRFIIQCNLSFHLQSTTALLLKFLFGKQRQLFEVKKIDSGMFLIPWWTVVPIILILLFNRLRISIINEYRVIGTWRDSLPVRFIILQWLQWWRIYTAQLSLPVRFIILQWWKIYTAQLSYLQLN